MTGMESNIKALVNAERNVGDIERWVSIAAGAALLAYAAKKRDRAATAAAVAGGAVLLRGVTGHCPVYGKLGYTTAEEGGEAAVMSHDRGIPVEASVTIDRPAAELYAFWRDLENLPRFMRHIERIDVQSDTRSHWVASGAAGKEVEWDAEIINEIPNELIAWSSVADAAVTNAGSVSFRNATGGRGTVVKVLLRYNPPGGRLTAAFAKLFRSEPSQLVRDDLARFKQLMETGEVSTTDGQTSGREK